MVTSDKIDTKVLLTDRFKLPDFQAAFDKARAPESVKVIVRPK